MEAVQAAAVAGKGKAVTNSRLQMKQKLAACPEALNLLLGKTAAGEQKGGTSGQLQMRCSEPCMPAVSNAGNRITWNLFLFTGTGKLKHAPPAVIPHP